MITIAANRNRREKDSTVALINIVFLMLIFFLIAGTIVPPLDSNVSPIFSEDRKNAELESVLSVRADGGTWFQGNPISIKAFTASFSADPEFADKPVRLFADSELAATRLIEIINQLQNAGAPSVLERVCVE